MYSQVKELRELSDVNKANLLLYEGWRLLEIYHNERLIYVLGRIQETNTACKYTA